MHSGSQALSVAQDQVITLEILVWLIQAHKTIKIERLAA